MSLLHHEAQEQQNNPASCIQLNPIKQEGKNLWFSVHQFRLNFSCSTLGLCSFAWCSPGNKPSLLSSWPGFLEVIPPCTTVTTTSLLELDLPSGPAKPCPCWLKPLLTPLMANSTGPIWLYAFSKHQLLPSGSGCAQGATKAENLPLLAQHFCFIHQEEFFGGIIDFSPDALWTRWSFEIFSKLDSSRISQILISIYFSSRWEEWKYRPSISGFGTLTPK